METQVEALDSISATKIEREDKELINEVTSTDFFPKEVKKLKSEPSQSLEASNYEEQTANIPVAIKYEVDQENAVTEAGVGTNQGETFLNSPPIPEIETNDSSNTPKEYEATKIKDQAEVFEIQTLEEEILKDQKIDIVASKETSDEQQLLNEEKLEKPQRDDKEHAMEELEQDGRLSESSSFEVKKENEGHNVDDSAESTAKQIAKKDNFKDPLVESTGEETVGYSQEEDATEQGDEIESFDANEKVIEAEIVENKIESQVLASNTDDITARSSQEDETTKERLEQEVPIGNEGATETEVQIIEKDNTTNIGPSVACVEINEANLKRKQNESDIEANRTNKEIEEQKTEESVNKVDLPSTATGEETVVEYLKEDETDEVKPKEEVKNLEMESIQSIDTKCHVEEETHQKESNEDLVVSFSVPQVSQKEAEDDNLDKEESATTELTEERSIKEVEKESNDSNLLLEEKSREIQVGSDDVNIIAEHSEVTEMVENKNIQISKTSKSEADEAERELTSGETTIEQTLDVTSAPSLTESQLGTTEDILKGSNMDDTDESTAKKITKTENFKGQLLESTGEETVSYSQVEDMTEQGAKIERFDAIEDIIEVEKVENKFDTQDLESNMEDITAKISQEYETTKERPVEKVPRIRIEEAVEKEAQIVEKDNTANFGPSADEESNESNLKIEQKESDLEANRTNKDIEERKTEESANKTDLPSTATGEETVIEYLKENQTDEVEPKEEVKNLDAQSIQNTDTKCHVEEEIHQKESVASFSMSQVSQKEAEDDNLDKEKSAIRELLEERSIKEVEHESNSSDLLLEEKTCTTIPSVTESQLGPTEVREIIHGNAETIENSNSNMQSLVTAENTEEKLEKKENEPMDPIEDTLVELKDKQMDEVNADENLESVEPLILVADEKSNETYLEINQTNMDEDEQNVNKQNLESVEEEAFPTSDTYSEEKSSGEISQEGQNETGEVESKSEAGHQIGRAEYKIEAKNDVVLTEEVPGITENTGTEELQEIEDTNSKPEASSIARAPEEEKMEDTEKAVIITRSSSEPSEENIEEIGNHGDVAETASTLVEVADNLESEDLLLRSELTLSEHAGINKEATVVAKPDIDRIEVEELKISDTETIREVTEAEKVQDIRWKSEPSPTAKAPEEEILEGTEKPNNFTISKSAISEENTKEENIEESVNHKDEAETATETSLEGVQLAIESTRDMDAAAVDTMELQDSSVISEVSAPEHAEINKESLALEKSATNEVEELEISDEKTIIGNTETAELQEVEDINREAEASFTTKVPEEEIMEDVKKTISVNSSTSELSEQTRHEKMEEIGNHQDGAETAQETVMTAETSSEGVELDNVSTRNLETAAGDSEKFQEVDNLELQDSSVMSQLASTIHADVNEETMVVEELATEEAEVEEPETSKAETSSYGQNDHPINESENFSPVNTSNTNTYQDEAGEETVCELDEKTCTTMPKGEDEREISIEQPLEESSAPCATGSQMRTTEVSEKIDGNTEIIENSNSNVQSLVTAETTEEKLQNKENEPMVPIEDTLVELKDIQMDNVNVEEVLGEAKKAEESEYINEQSEENIEEVGNRGDKAETAVDTMELQESSVISELTTPEHAEMKEHVVVEKSATNEVEELKISDVKPINGNTETEELRAVEDINLEAEVSSSTKAPEEEIMESFDSLELQDSSVITKLASVEYADINKETMAGEELATDEIKVEELEISNAETSSYEQHDHSINESEKISTVRSSVTNTYEEETYKVLESKSEAKYQVVEAVAESNNVPELTHSAEDLTEQFQMPSSATLLREQELQTTTTDEKVGDESPMKEESLSNEKIERSTATNPREETCLPVSEVEISTLDREFLDKNDSPSESSTRETEDLQKTIAEEPREYTSMIQLTDTISEIQENKEKLDSENSTEEDKAFLVPHSQANSLLPTESPNLELQEIEKAAESASDLQSPEVLKSEETEMKEEQTQVAATESREKENLEEKLIKEDETIDDDISSEKTIAGTEDDKGTSVASLEVVHIQELSQELEAVGENRDSTDEGKAAGDTHQDLNADRTDSISCTQETEKERNVEEALTRPDLQERDWNDTNVETKSPNQEIEGVTVENGEAKKIEDSKEEFVEEDNCIAEVQTTSASEETANEIAYSDPVTVEKLESKVWSTETKVEELEATEDINLELEEFSITETSEKEIKLGTQKPVDITSSIREVSVEEIEEEKIKEAATFNENIDTQPVTLITETSLEEDQEAEKLIKGPNIENRIEKADEANEKIEDTRSSEKVADDEVIARNSMSTNETEEVSEDLLWNGVQRKAEENVAGAGEAILNSNQDLVVEGTANENISPDAGEAKNYDELPREVETQETANKTDCIEIGVETIVPSEGINSDSERIEITEATDLTTGTEIENLRAEDLKSKSEALADEMSESNENPVNITSPVIEVPEEYIGEKKLEADIITDTPLVTLVKETSSEEVQQDEQLIKGSEENAETKEAHMSQEDEEVDSVKLEEISSMVTQISREQHAFIGTEEVTSEKPSANEAEEIVTSERALVSIGLDHNDVFETDKFQEDMNSIPYSIAKEKEDVKLSMSSASVPIEELCEEPRGVDAQEKGEERNAGVEKLLVESSQVSVEEGTANENLPQEGTASRIEDSKDQNLESTAENINCQDFQEVQSEMNKEVGHKLEEENDETQGMNETEKDVFLMDDKSQEAVVEIQAVEEIVSIKEEITEGGICIEELKSTSKSDENLRGAVEEIREVEEIVNIYEENTEGGSGTEELKTISESDEHSVKYQADETVIEGGKIPDMTHLATNLTEKSYESSPSEMIQEENDLETTTEINKVEDKREKKDGTLVTELEEDSLESITAEPSKETPKELHISQFGFFEVDADKHNENPNEAAREERTVVEEAAAVEPQEDVDNKKTGESLIPSPMGIQENVGEKCEKDTIQDYQKIEEVLESEVTESEEVHPKTAPISSVDEENQSQIANEKIKIVTEEVSSDKTTLDKEVAEDSLLLSANEEKIRGSYLEDEIKTLDYPGENTNQKLEATKIWIPAEETSHEHEKADKIKNIISLGDRNAGESLPEEVKDENCLKEAPNLQERSKETGCRDINTEDKNIIEESNVSEEVLIKHETDQAASTEKNNVTPNYEVRSKDFEAQTDEGERAQKSEGKEEEEEGDENERVDSGSDGPVMVEAARDADVKACKKSHGILSGVGSKVKHSISKVKKVITGKSSHPKSSSPK